MNRLVVRVCLLIWVGLLLVNQLPAAEMKTTGETRAELWKRVDEALGKGLPKSAIEALDPIIAGATKDKAHAELVRALGMKIALEGQIQGQKPEERITRLEAELVNMPKEVAPLLTALLANWYWQYFEQNRWRFMQRTATAEPPGKDIQTWDLSRLFREIDTQFTRALAAADLLKKTPVTAFDGVLVKGTMPDACRPTLYDFVAHEALDFYTSAEQAGARPQDAFEITADSQIFAPVEEFMRWKPETTDVDSPKLKAIKLYQDLLTFHKKDKDPSAFIEADLSRLLFGWNAARGDEKNARFKAALEKLVTQWADHELSALARYHWARVLNDEGDPAGAHKVAKQGAGAFPNSVGGRNCKNLVEEIEAESVQIETERIWNAPWPKIEVRYRNVTKTYFRAIPVDWWQYGGKRRWGWGGETVDNKAELLGSPPALEWSADLPPTTDFQERTELVPAPETLKPGFYFIVASHAPDFSTKRNQISYVGVWVSDLALVTRSTGGEVSGFVLGAASGEPIAGATIEARGWGWASGREFTKEFKTTTDSNGLFRITVGDQSVYSLAILAQQQGRSLGTWQSCYGRSREPQKPYEQTIFFTDRALYRPGQTIQYKGICLRVDRETDNYELLPGRTLTVIFQDHNGKEVARQRHRCNDYGSFFGSFTAPRDRLMGHMTIRVEGEPRGSVSFNVEEYKRPKFRVTLDAPTTAARLNDKVKVLGKAMSYTGAAIDGAQVKYRVTREVCLPDWWWWGLPRRSWGRIPWQRGEAQEIAFGTTKTEADGSFTIEFVAIPDLSVSPTNEPTFHFRVSADVTDSSGETRSDERTIIVGYTALQATMSVTQQLAGDEKAQPKPTDRAAVAGRSRRIPRPPRTTTAEWLASDHDITLQIRTTTHDGVGQSAEGVVRVHKLKEPLKTPRASLGYEEGENPADPNTWALGDVVWEKQFSTDNEGKQSLTLRLESGTYRAVLETQDRFKKKVTAKLPVIVINPAATKLGLKIPHLFTAPRWSLEPGEDFVALWGTGYDAGRAFVEIEHRGKLLQSFWTKPDTTQFLVRQPVTEAMRGGFSIRVTYVRENRAYLENRLVSVPWSNKQLDLKWEHFTSKLEPGQKETWSLIITGPQAERVTAEMVAALYDRSLDQFRAHGWPSGFNCFRYESCGPSYVFANDRRQFMVIESGWERTYVDGTVSYREFPPELLGYFWGYGRGQGRVRALGYKGMLAETGVAANGAEFAMAKAAAPEAAAAPMALRRAGEPVGGDDKNAAAEQGLADRKRAEKAEREARGPGGGEAARTGGPDLAQVSARKNLNETAFFFPQLLSDSNGVVKITFTMPEALTEWRFLGFAHDSKLRSGALVAETVTARELMVQPNPPRFLREGDVLEFTVKVSNQSPARQTGKVMLNLFDARTDKPVDKDIGNSRAELAFDIPSMESRSYSWRLTVPDGMGFLRYKAVASTGRLSDGEEGYLPVLPRRILVTESLPLPIRGPATKKFEFTRLQESRKSDTLRHQSLTVQMVSNPSWYAVMALPYLMEFPYECSEQVFNRLYANALARFIALSDPKIARVFEQWKNTHALDLSLIHI
ncbi:MAG: MG2 domain-containing protein, partial [Kiritimatiellae bacterium]|nr:MG2 domain-containing protein [Kiritimatiellia bacterium]